VYIVPSHRAKSDRYLDNTLSGRTAKKRELLEFHYSHSISIKVERGSMLDLKSGAERDRTVDLLNAIQALSQLSYSPFADIKNIISDQGLSRLSHSVMMYKKGARRKGEYG
jgi:hypothetical protein